MDYIALDSYMDFVLNLGYIFQDTKLTIVLK